MELTSLLALNAAIISGCFFLLWLLSLWLKDAGIVDIFWGLGFVVIAITTCLVTEAVPRSWLVALLATLWGCRLAAYLAWRNIGKDEDYRYREMRDYHGSRFPLVSLYLVFGLQAVIMLVVSLPLQLGQLGNEPLGIFDYLGIAAWGIGFLFESVGDYQLARFKADPNNQGKVLDRGLWRYTRHPNYFGDFMIWWGFYLLAVGAGAYWTVISPLIMSFFLIRVSGVALLEKAMVDKRPKYADYIANTSAFFPWPPKKAKST